LKHCGLREGDEVKVKHISYTLESDMKQGRTKGYLVEDTNGHSICLYPEEVIIVNDDFEIEVK
jgi:hypothetical protein